MRSVCLRVREKLWDSIVTTEVFSRGDPGIHARQRVLCRGKQVVGQKGWQNESTGTPIEGRTFWWPKIISPRAAAETQTTVKIQRTATDWEIMTSWRKELSQDGATGDFWSFGSGKTRVAWGSRGIVVDQRRSTNSLCITQGDLKKQKKKKEQLTCNLKKRRCEM